MAAADIANIWDNIRRGVKDAELLIGQKKYNMSMIKSRQVLELMVSYLCDNAAITAEDLASAIDALYDSEWITKTTCEHYHKIRMLGNKAVHEGNDNGYDANQAYHLLSQEVYTFANDYKSKKNGSGASSARSGRSSSQNRGPSPRSQSGRGQGSRSSASRGSGSRSSGSRSSASRGSRNSRSRKRQPSSGFSVSPTDLIRLGLIVIVILVIVLAVRLLSPKKTTEENETSSSASQETLMQPTVPETTAETVPVETMADTTPAPVYKTTAGLNVRSEPSTAGSILGLLESGTIIDYVEDYDDEWVVINYNGTEAYVSSQYLAHD